MAQYGAEWLLVAHQFGGSNPPPILCLQSVPVHCFGVSTLAPSASSDDSMVDTLCADDLLSSVVNSFLQCSPTEGSITSAGTAVSCETPRSSHLMLVDPALASASAAEAAFRNIRDMELRGLQQLGCQGLKLPQDPNYLTASLRAVAVSWLVEVVAEFSLTQDSLFLAVGLLDRFLQVSQMIPKQHAQLVAITCLYVASKVEEERFPSAALCVRIADGCFRKEDVLSMESLLLNQLRFNTHIPTALRFVHLLSQILGLGKAVEQRALLLAELSLLDATVSSAPAWCTATACVLAALRHAGVVTDNCMALQQLSRVLPCELSRVEPWVLIISDMYSAVYCDQDPQALHAPIMEKYMGW